MHKYRFTLLKLFFYVLICILRYCISIYSLKYIISIRKSMLYICKHISMQYINVNHNKY